MRQSLRLIDVSFAKKSDRALWPGEADSPAEWAEESAILRELWALASGLLNGGIKARG
jgi:hypothetical protein